MSDLLNYGDEDSNRLGLNFDGIVEGSFGPIPAGKYLMKVNEASITTTKNGDPSIKLVMSVDVSPDDPLYFKKVYENVACVPPRDGKVGSLWRARQILTALTGIEIGQGKIDLDVSGLVGRRVYCTLKIDEYNAPNDKTDASKGYTLRYNNKVETWEADYDSAPGDFMTVQSNFSQ